LGKDRKKKPTIIVAGPTASGKSALALKLAQIISGEIVNADSMQVYSELKILTARPSDTDQEKIPHHLYGHIPISQQHSVGLWRKQALTIIEEIHSRKNIPIICGGTGLYLRVLQEGLAEIPSIPKKYIEQAELIYTLEGAKTAFKELKRLDPKFALTIKLNDRQRVIRALSVINATGQPITKWKQNQPLSSKTKDHYFSIHILPPRTDLYGAIEDRFDQMITAGVMSEIEHINSLQLTGTLPAIKAIGFSELIQAHLGEITISAAIEKAKKATRNLAKRQFSWFRNQAKANLIIPNFVNQETLSLSIEETKKFLMDK